MSSLEYVPNRAGGATRLSGQCCEFWCCLYGLRCCVELRKWGHGTLCFVSYFDITLPPRLNTMPWTQGQRGCEVWLVFNHDTNTSHRMCFQTNINTIVIYVHSFFFPKKSLRCSTLVFFGLFSPPGVKRLRCQANPLSPASAEIRNEWSYTSTPPLSSWHSQSCMMNHFSSNILFVRHEN